MIVTLISRQFISTSLDPFKKHVAGKQFATHGDVKQAVTSRLQTLDTKLFYAWC
jgi:hypothetical protein